MYVCIEIVFLICIWLSCVFSEKKYKSIISQKLRITQKKLCVQKMSVRSIPIYLVNLATFSES